MPTKKILVALLIIVVAIGGFVAGLYLLRQNQNVQEEAAVPGGQATVSVSPESGNFNVGDNIDMQVYFNTANIAISGVAVRMLYPFSGSSPEIVVDSININQSLISSGDWTCPTQEVDQEGSNVVVDVACVNSGSATGYRSSNDTLLATVTLHVDRQPASNPVSIIFDPAESMITRRSDNEDILLIPSSTGSYTIGGGTQPTAQPTAEPSPTVGAGSPTPTTKPTATPTKVATTSASITPVGKGGLPDAGVSYPTILGIGVGILTLVGVAALAL
jgi:hypothetical protein